jgi:hypothetical protein
LVATESKPTPAKRRGGWTLWQPGQSGNPNGRPKGARNKITLLKESLELQLREQAAPDLSKVMKKAVELAIEGDRAMIKLLLDLHIGKGHTERENAVEKVEINISSESPKRVEPVRAINVIDAEVISK